MSDEATDILQQTQEAFDERVNAVRIAKSLRSKTTPPRAAMVMEQAQLRIRGRQKFELADQILDRVGLGERTSNGVENGHDPGRRLRLAGRRGHGDSNRNPGLRRDVHRRRA